MGKTAANAMTFEDIGKLTPKAKARNLPQKLQYLEFDKATTGQIVWYLVKRHRYVLLVNAFVLENLYLGLHFFNLI